MSKKYQKIIIIGLDGLEPSAAGPMMDAGLLPNLAALRGRGGAARVRTTGPAQTPVAWSSFATGLNPGGHGVFDFLRRDPSTYLPDLALNRYERRNAFTPPRAVNLRRGEAIWTRLAEAGVPSAVIRCPCTYPPDPLRGRLLSGMGVPDIRGGLGTSTYYDTDPTIAAGEAERVVTLEAGGGGPIASRLIGPRDPWDGTDAAVGFTLTPAPEGGRAWFRCEGASPAEFELVEGRWSDWVRVRFRLGAFRSMRGMVRLLLTRTAPGLALYASPVNFDPEAPPFPLSEPVGYAGELLGAIGPYSTTGMVEDHAGLSNGRLDEPAFLAQCELAWREREAMMRHELNRFDEGLFFCLFDTPDRVQHMFWRHNDPGHPANRGRPPSGEFAGVIAEHYRRADSVVGEALEAADDRTLTIVLSDHGFGPFRRGVDLNGWLHARGLLALREGLRPGPEAGDLLRGVDWSRTRAYAVGLGGIYLNLRGRESSGVVEPDEAEGLKAGIADGLLGLRDPADGAAPIRRVLPREKVYRGPFVGEAPDLLVHCGRGYRVSWAAAAGGVGASVVEDNTRPWSGDHIVDPDLVPGVLLMSRPFRVEQPSLIDLAPTILDALGIPPAPELEGRSLL